MIDRHGKMQIAKTTEATNKSLPGFTSYNSAHTSNFQSSKILLTNLADFVKIA